MENQLTNTKELSLQGDRISFVKYFVETTQGFDKATIAEMVWKLANKCYSKALKDVDDTDDAIEFEYLK